MAYKERIPVQYWRFISIRPAARGWVPQIRIFALAAFGVSLIADRAAQGQCTAYDPPLVTTGNSIVPGTADINNHCDDCGNSVTLPFTWNFYGTNYTTIIPTSNGYITFVAADSQTNYNETGQCV